MGICIQISGDKNISVKKKKPMGHKKTDDKNNNCNHNFQLYFNSILWSVEEKKLTDRRKEK